MITKPTNNQEGFAKSFSARFYSGTAVVGAATLGIGLLLRKSGVDYTGLMIAACSLGGMGGAYLRHLQELRRERRSNEAMCRRVLDARAIENYGQDPNASEKRILRS